MELRHVRYFVAVAEEQNITRAAARLHVSQPPLSRQMRDLEQELGVDLFERSARAVRLTPAGWAFLEECYGTLKQVDRSVRAARNAACGSCGEVNLGYAPGPTQQLLREVLRIWRKTDAGIRVILHDLTTREMLQGLDDGTLQVALMVAPGRKLGRGLTFSPLRSELPMAAVAPDHPFAKRKSVSPLDLAREPLVIFSRDEYPEYVETISRVLGRSAARLRIAEECDSGVSLITAVEAGQGVSIFSRSMTPATGHGITFVRIVPPPEPSVVGIATLSRNHHPALKRLTAAALTVAKLAA